MTRWIVCDVKIISISSNMKNFQQLLLSMRYGAMSYPHLATASPNRLLNLV